MATGHTTCPSEFIASSKKFVDAFKRMSEAHSYARDTCHSVWDFAVEIDVLRKAGLNVSDLRWLVCKGFVEHAHEVTRPGDEHREFRPGGKLTFNKRTCFVLTDQGVACGNCAPDIAVESQDPRITATDERVQNNGSSNRPAWDPERHELRLGGTLVKQFKWPALNQETILTAFEEEEWPPRIDDPLPPHAEQDPKRRLSDTIKCLNRKQTNQLLHFRGDGTGEGVVWELVEEYRSNGGQRASDK